MSSSPQRSPRTTPRTTPRRTPLQERTQSEANELSFRLQRDLKPSVEPRNPYTTSPFPTKPQQILLPSTLRKQKSSQNLVADIFGSNNGAVALTSPQQVSGVGKRPAVRLKRSVKTLRDLYESQGDDSRPTTALSSSRPGTSSSKLRSFSSSDGLSGRYAWDQFKSTSSIDDLALLPSLPEGQSSLRRPGSQSSFASRAARKAATSSPNFRVLGATSSPRIPVFKDLSEASSELSENLTNEPTSNDESQSSPNVVKLGRTSSFEDTPSLDPPSPTVTRLGVSPARTIVAVAPSSPVRRCSSTSSTASRKRKRDDGDAVRSFAARIGAPIPFPSSPPMARPSAPDEETSPAPPSDSLSSDVIHDSSPIVRVLQNDSSSIDQISVEDTHASLQDAISSSPAAPIQYPVVRAPTDVQAAGIVIPKRKYRSSHTSDSIGGSRWPARLSAPSQESFSRSRNASLRSSWAEEPDDLDTDSLAPGQAYMLNSYANNSQIRIVQDADRHEGEDEVSALPGDDYDRRLPSMLNRSTSFLGSANSSQSRLGSLDMRLDRIRSYSQSRQNSLRSFRPDSSSSAMSQLAMATWAPTWVKRYYSGLYPDSFHILAASVSHVNLSQTLPSLPATPQQRPDSSATSRSSRHSLQSLRESIAGRVSSLVRPKNRPRLEARKSHSMPGLGPLVSNPVRGAATAAMPGQTLARYSDHQNVRPVSLPLSLYDPRAHWNGMVEGLEHIPEGQVARPAPSHMRPVSADPSNRSMIYSPSRNRKVRRPSDSPHLHHDRRLNTGSTTSRGFGHPFNRKSYFPALSLHEEPDESSIKTIRNIQVAMFLLGFVVPLGWFVGASLPLPQRPDAYQELEKGVWERERAHPRSHPASAIMNTESQEMDVLARLKMEKQFRGSEEMMWQNVRWWRTLNRWMCIVGVLVLILVIVLAVIGTKAWRG